MVRGQQGAIPAASDAPVGQAALPDQVAPDPGSIRSERPGPPPAPGARISETYLAARGPDIIDVNERKWSAKKAALREDALAVAAKVPKADRATPLFGTPLDPAAEGEAEGGEAAEAGGESPGEGEQPTTKERDAAELRAIAKTDRENRRLRKELKALERKGASSAKKDAWLREQAKKNPRGVMAFLGLTDQDVLTDIRNNAEKAPEVPKWEEPAADPPENTELEQERSKRRRLEMQVAERNTSDALQRMVQADGASRWAAAAAMGQDAINEAMARSMELAKTMKRAPTKKEALGVLELCLDEVNEKYAGIAKRLGGGTQAKTKGKPQPRNPVTVPRQNPMDKNPFKDSDDPRNRPTWREIGERSRRKYFGS